MQLLSADAIKFSKKISKNFLTWKKWKNGPQKLLIIGQDPFISQSSPDQRPTAQNWFFILWNLGTRHLFSYLWAGHYSLSSNWYPLIYVSTRVLLCDHNSPICPGNLVFSTGLLLKTIKTLVFFCLIGQKPTRQKYILPTLLWNN